MFDGRMSLSDIVIVLSEVIRPGPGNLQVGIEMPSNASLPIFLSNLTSAQNVRRVTHYKSCDESHHGFERRIGRILSVQNPHSLVTWRKEQLSVRWYQSISLALPTEFLSMRHWFANSFDLICPQKCETPCLKFLSHSQGWFGRHALPIFFATLFIRKKMSKSALADLTQALKGCPENSMFKFFVVFQIWSHSFPSCVNEKGDSGTDNSLNFERHLTSIHDRC